MEVILTGTEVTVNYTEPTKNKNGTPLTDLHHTSIFATIGGVKEKVADVPATSPNGGGHISEKIIVDVAEEEELDVTVTASSFDTAGNPSNPATDPFKVVRIDRLPPGSPV